MLDHFTSELDGINYSFHILNTVKQEDTRWQFVYDIKNLRVIYRTHISEEMFKINFNVFDKIGNNREVISLHEISKRKQRLSDKENKRQINFVKDRLEAYYPGKEHIYDLMVEEGERNLETKSKRLIPISN